MQDRADIIKITKGQICDGTVSKITSQREVHSCIIFDGVSRILGKWEREAGTGTTDGKCLKKDIMSIY